VTTGPRFVGVRLNRRLRRYSDWRIARGYGRHPPPGSVREAARERIETDPKISLLLLQWLCHASRQTACAGRRGKIARNQRDFAVCRQVPAYAAGWG
jgi:hypothetical protein